MSAAAILMIAVIIGSVWGGFVFFIFLALRFEKRKRGGNVPRPSGKGTVER